MYRVLDSSDYEVLTTVSEVVASSMVAGGSSEPADLGLPRCSLTHPSKLLILVLSLTSTSCIQNNYEARRAWFLRRVEGTR